MSIIRVGGEPADFDSCTLVYNTTSGRFDGSYARSCLLGNGPGTGARLVLPSSLTDVWIKFRAWQGANAGSVAITTPATFVGVATPAGMLLRVGAADFTAGNRGLMIQRNSAGTWSTLGTAWTSDWPIGAGSVVDFALRVKVHASTGSIELYRNSLLICSYSGDTTFSSAIASVVGLSLLSTDNTTYGQAFSEVVVADEDARAFRLKRMTPDAAGANTAWTGAYTDVDDTGVNDADAISSATATQEVSFGTDCSVSGTGVWKALLVVARAAKGTSGPATLEIGAKGAGSASYPSSNALTTAYVPVNAVMATNPATSAAWTNSDLNAVELALRSAT
jgi:hypothetical protein